MTFFSGIMMSEKYMLCDIVYDAVKLSVENCYDLEEVADEFCGGDVSQAFADCFRKGLQEYQMMLQMGREENLRKAGE